jgi:adenylate cyclase class 2
VAIEIELKAWVDDPAAVKRTITQFARYNGAFTKDDAYWFPARRAPDASLPASGVRLRRETLDSGDGQPVQTTLVTYKTKEVREGMEINDEREFAVSDGAAFEELLTRLGLSPGKTKQKRGWSWSHEGITLELTEVTGLGWFAELELLTGTDSPEIAAAARKRLLALLQAAGIAEDRIEARYYTELLTARL